MAARDGGSAGNVLMAFTLGALAGAAVALLYAPASGEETRRKIRQKARDGRDAVADLVEDGRDFIERQKENIERQREKLARQIDNLQQSREDVAAAVERGREVFEQERREHKAQEKL